MPILAGLIAAVGSALASFFATFLTKKVALAVALVAAVVLLTGTIYVTLEGLFSAVAYVMPSYVQDAACMLLPSNLQACMTAIIAGKVAEYVYIWKVKVLQWKLL